MCGGSSSTGKGKSSASSDFGGYSFGTGKGSIADQRRSENRAAMSGGSNISNYAGKSALGGEGTTQAGTVQSKAAEALKPVEKAKVTSIAGTYPTAPLTAFDELQEDIEEGKTVNAQTYSKLGLEAIDLGRMFDTGKNMVEAQKVDKNLGTWAQPVDSPSLSWNTLQFTPNRKADGEAWDKLTNTNRTYSMTEAEKDVASGQWEDRAPSLASGNTYVDEKGKAQEDKIGTAISALSLAKGLLTPLFSGVSLSSAMSLSSAYNAYDELSRTSRLYGDKQTTSNRGQAAAAEVNGTSVGSSSSMLGDSDSEKRGARLLAAKDWATGTTASTSTQPTTSSVDRSRNRLSLMLTGGRGLTNSPDRMFMRLMGA